MGGIEVRGDGGLPRLRGHAAVFNSLSQPISIFGFSFRERMAPGAFSDSIARGDIAALWKHDSSFPLGHTRNGTLTLSEDDRGLAIDLKPAATSYGKDLVALIERGDVSKMSFGFQVPKDGDSWDVENGEDIRTLRKVSLIEVSPVAFPAYTATDISARAIGGVEMRDLFAAFDRLARGEASDQDRLIIRRASALAGLTERERTQLDTNRRRLRIAAAA